MERPWDPEVTLDDATARLVIVGAFPEFAGAEFRPLGDGWDNRAFLVRADQASWVFRLPRRAVAAPLMDVETSVLPAIASLLPVAVPVPVRLGSPTGGYPWPFAGYRALPGETACRRNLDDRARTRLAPALGRFLRALHAIPTAPLQALGLPLDEIGRLIPAVRLPQIEARLAAAHRKGLVADPAAILRCAAAVDPARGPRTDILVHGDLYARHLLLGDDDSLVGVIDWGDIHSGDPAEDLGLIVGFLPKSARAAFASEYGSVDDATWGYARLRAILLATALLVYGEDVGDEALLREGQTGLRFAME